MVGLLGLLLWPSMASAQAATDAASAAPDTSRTPSDTAAQARELFDQGRALMDQKDYATACAKLEESQRLDPGGGTLLNLALCHELLGKTATAWAEFHEGLRIAVRDGRGDRQELAEQHLKTVGPKLSRLSVVVPKSARAAGLVIRRNGVAIGEAVWGEPFPVDPGEQVLEISAPGKISVRRAATVGPNGDLQQVIIDPLKDLSVAPAETASVSHRAPEKPVGEPATETGSGSHQRLYALVTGGAGVAALGVGTVFGIRALQLMSRANSECSSYCSTSGIRDSRSAATSANVSTGFFIGGAVLTSLGAVLFLTAPAERSLHAFGPEVQVALGALSASVSATF
ncbi:MAG TPA: hypothetical protein VGJ84_11270 [Polyangiaceae bacterium]|jgi:hypothetical protein